VGYGQAKAEPAELNFGTFTSNSVNVREILFRNIGNETMYILRLHAGPELDYQIESKKLAPGQASRIRFKFNPRQTGIFKFNAEVWISQSEAPVIVPITANVISFDPTDHLQCPSFRDESGKNNSSLSLKILVTDSIHHLPIANAVCRISDMTGASKEFATDKNGELTLTLSIGYYIFQIQGNGYRDHQWDGYVNNKTGLIEIVLVGLPTSEPILTTTLDSTTEIDAEEFSIAHYKPNNVVFLIDISASMGQHGKLDLMKKCLEQYCEVIRPEDRVSLVSFSREAQLILTSQTGHAKDSIQKSIANIKASGSTDPVAGFKKSRRELRKHLIRDGNNEIVIFTDGAFSRDAEITLNKMIRSASKRDERISAVLISGSDLSKAAMQSIIQQGDGSFLFIDDALNGSRPILEMIKTHCRK
jgi:Mg-chelatase subunit ChlD